MKENKVYILNHINETELGGVQELKIGTFSSLERAIDEKNKRLNIVGFKDYPDGFKVEVFIVDKDGCQETINL
ncbi:hypothetical protein RHO12_02980 [Orbus sturtevantii]|uniref:serine kinase n=1 Tax=Orbus sturtevantii TaxID=3074109 RepID=UPI00370DC9B0